MIATLRFFRRFNLGLRFALVFGALALVGLAGFGGMTWLLLASRADANTINLAGRQRMLIERMAKEAAEMSLPGFADTGAPDELRDAAENFDRTLTGLLEGDAALGLPALQDPQARAAAERLRAQWLPFRADVDSVLSAPDPAAQMEVTHSLLTAEDALLAEADELVALLQAHAEGRFSGLWQFGLLTGGLLMLIVTGGWILVERHVSRPLRRLVNAAQEMARGDLRAGASLPLQSRDEIGRLTLAFTDMAETLDGAFAAMRESNQQLVALNAVSAIVGESLEAPRLLEDALEAALTAVDMPIGLIALFDSDGQALRVQASRGLPDVGPDGFRPLRPGEDVSGQAAATGEPIIVEDAQNDSRLQDPLLRAAGVRCYISLPINRPGRVLGVLNLATPEPRLFSSSDLTLLTGICHIIAAALEQSLEHEAVARRAGELQALAEVGGLVTAGGDLQSALDTLAIKVAQAANFEGVGIALLDPAADELWFLALHTTARLGLLEGRKGTRSQASAAPLTQRLMRERQPIEIGDPQHDPLVGESQRELCRRDGVRSVIVLPLLFGDRLIGALDLISTRPRYFQSDRNLLELLASQVAAAVANAQLLDVTQKQYAESSERLAELRALFEVSGRLAAAHSLDDVLQLVVDRARASVPQAEKAVIHLVDWESGLLVPRAISGAVGPRACTPDLRIDRGIAGRAVRERRPVYVPDVGLDPDFVDTGVPIRSLAVVPLIVGDEVLGTLSVTPPPPRPPSPPQETGEGEGEVLGTFSVDSTRPRAFGEDNLRLLTSLGHQAAVAVKKAQITDSLRESLGQLQQRSTELETSLAQLQAAQSQLVQAGKLASLGTLAAGIAHELNNPLAGIKTYAQNLLRFQQKSRLTPDVLTENLTAIDGLVDKASRIIQHFRTYTRQSPGAFKAVDLNQPVREALSMMSEQLRLRDITVVSRLAADLPPVRADANQLEQVLVNLLSNARDALAGSTRRELRLSTYSLSLSRRAAAGEGNGDGGGEVVIEVADTGGGIPPEIMDKIFDPFFTTKEVGRGTGLGLSISHGIIERHGGRIEVETAPGEGATFRLALPMAEG